VLFRSATNPCHVYDMAVSLHGHGALAAYLSGYPKWKLKEFHGLPVRTHPGPTLTTYGLLKLFPGWTSVRQESLFQWQDQQFDDWAAGVLSGMEGVDFFHGLPGQCAASFAAAKGQGMQTVLNHAAGPRRIQQRLVAAEFRAAGMKPPTGFAPVKGEGDFSRQEYEWADFHLAASRIVKSQLAEAGVPEGRIGVVPYGADAEIFYRGNLPPDDFRILFAGTLCLRKGIRYLLRALDKVSQPDWRIRLAGHRLPEAEPFLDSWQPPCDVQVHDPVAQPVLADWMRASSVLVLPSVEEAFGLVVVQALSCGLPCVVSDRVGAADLIRHRENGSVVPVGDVDALAEEIRWWSQNPFRVTGDYGWEEPASQLLDWSRKCLEQRPGN